MAAVRGGSVRRRPRVRCAGSQSGARVRARVRARVMRARVVRVLSARRAWGAPGTHPGREVDHSANGRRASEPRLGGGRGDDLGRKSFSHRVENADGVVVLRRDKCTRW